VRFAPALTAMQIDTVTHRSPNYDSRPAGTVIRALVIHTGEGTKASDLHELTIPGTQKSAHYYNDRDGHLYELVHPRYRAWHAGASSYAGITSWNDFAIGIESEHKQGQNWPAAQRAAFKALCEYLMAEYHIANGLIVAHRWIAPNRKEDPTDWPDQELRPWIAALHAAAPIDPLRANTIPGAGGKLYFCGAGFWRFYYRHEGLLMLGLPIGDERFVTDRSKKPGRTMMPFERGALKYIPDVTPSIQPALISEAVEFGWLP
jgi:AmpD protein